MIFGDCPHCDHPFIAEVPDNVPLPVFAKHTCDNCGKWFWERISRINPAAFLPEQVEVDEKTKWVRLKEGVE